MAPPYVSRLVSLWAGEAVAETEFEVGVSAVAALLPQAVPSRRYPVVCGASPRYWTAHSFPNPASRDGILSHLHPHAVPV